MSKLEALTIHTAHNTLKQSSEMLLYDTFKLYFDIDLENDIQHINESKEALDTFLKDCKNDYIQILQNDITQENLKTLQASKEYLALLHIQYCGDSKQVFGKGFKEALKEQSRLKLWYEIRYNSGSTKNKDIALRRFKQSNLFGLYENNDINNIILQPLYDSTPLTNNLNQYKVSLNEAITFFTFLNIAKHPQSHTYYTSIISLEAAIKKYFTNNDFPQSQSLDSITQAFLNTMKQYYIQEHNPSLSIGSIYIIQKSKNKPNVIDNIATINKRMWQNNASTFFVFYPEHISDIALQIRQKPNSLLYLIVCKDTKIDCAYLESTSKLYMSDFKDSQSTNYYLGTETQYNTQSTQESATSQENTYLELEPNGNDIADTQQEYIFKNAEPILTINKHQSNILLYNIGFAKQGNSISNEISKDTKVNKLGIALRLKDNKAHSTDCSKEGNFTLHINELYIYCSTQHSSIPNTHTTQNQSQDSIDSMHDSHNTQGQPIIYLLNCENRKTYPIALQANTDTNGNIIQDKADNTSYNAILSTELNLDMKATTKLILSCNDLVAQHYSTYDIHKITGVGIVSVNYDLKQKAKKGESIIYKNVLQLKQTTTLDEMITNTDSILEVRINNTQKPLKIDTTLECEALYYGYNLIQWAYMILPTKEYNPNKTKLQKDIDYYELPSDTYKGNIISFNPKEYLQSKDNAPSNQPNSKDNPPNYSQQLQYLTQGDYTLVIFAYQKTPAYKVKNYTTHTKLTYNPPLSLRFNGKELQIVEWGEVKKDSLDSKQYDKNKIFIARSGKPLSLDSQTNQDSATQHNTDSLILNPDNPQEYFEYSKQRQKDKDKGAIPEGTYYIDISQSTDNKQSGIREYNNAWYSFSRSKEGEKQWGKYNIPIYTDKDCTNTTESSTKRQGFYIHGGESYGDNGGIDLSKEDTRFFNTLESLKQEYKDILESIKDDKGRIIIKLEVGYNQVTLEIARLKAFMYALRYGEGTLGDKGYKTIVGGGTFDDFSKHPNAYVKKLNSTAAGAYQFLFTTWNGIQSQYGKKYNINDFSPKNQDKGCIIILYKYREALKLIMDNKIDEAIQSREDKPKKRLHYEWASLPNSPYGQRTESIEDFMKYYNKHLAEELKGISNLALRNEEIAEFLRLLKNK